MKIVAERLLIVRAISTASIAAAASIMAVGTQSAGQTALLAAVGVLYLCVPPSGHVPRKLLVGVILILLIAAIPLLPASWVGSPFRSAFIAKDFFLPETASMQAWWTLEDLTLLLATFLWAWNCLGSELTLEQRQFLQASYVLFLGVIAFDTLFRGKLGGFSLPNWILNVGQFANRNQTADLLFMGGVSSGVLGIDQLWRKKSMAIGWLALTVLFLVAAIHNGSRAGLFLLAAGLVIACLNGAARHSSFGWKPALVVVVGIGVFLFLGGGALRDRVGDAFKSGHNSRIPIYEDAGSLLLHSSWHGVGLGNFEGVFNTVRVESRDDMTRNLHPESDWLWSGIELGWIGLIVFIITVAIAFRTFVWDRPISTAEKAAQIIAGLFLIHSLIDVGAHRMGTMWTCLYLVGLGVVGRTRTVKVCAIPRLMLRFLGLLLLVVALLRVQALSISPWIPIRGSLDVVEGLLSHPLPLPEQERVLSKALSWAPLNWRLYGQRACWSVQAQRPIDETDMDFQRALYLDQSSIELPLAIGEIYRRIDFEMAMSAWRETLARAGSRRGEIYRTFFFYPDLDAKSRLKLATLAGNDPDLRVIAVIYQQAPEFELLRAQLLAIDPNLDDVRPEFLKPFFEQWVEVGNVDDYIECWPLHLTWQAIGWRPYARALSQAGRYREAVEISLTHLPNPPEPRTNLTLSAAKERYQNSPQDFWMGLQVYAAEKAEGLDSDALHTLQEVSNHPGTPVSVMTLLAKCLLQANREEEAWKVIMPLSPGS